MWVSVAPCRSRLVASVCLAWWATQRPMSSSSTQALKPEWNHWYVTAAVPSGLR